MRKYNILMTLLLAIVLITMLPLHVYATEPIKVFIDGQQVNFSIQPVQENGTTLVEFRPIFERLGLQVSWDQTTETVIGRNNNLIIKLTIGNKTASVNGQSKELLLPPRIINDRTLIPIRFVGEASGAIVKWDSNTSSIDITSEAKRLEVVKEAKELVELLNKIGNLLTKQDEADTTISLEEYKAESINLTYNVLARETEKYVGTKVHLKGKVVQVLEDGSKTVLRVNITKSKYGNYSDTILVNYILKSNDKRFLDNDIVVIWGEVKGRKTYTAIFGQSVTLPEINAREIEILTF